MTDRELNPALFQGMVRSRRKQQADPAAPLVRRGRPDFVLLVMTLVLVGFGIIMVFSSSANVASVSAETNFDPFYYTLRQSMFALIGIVAMLVLMNIPYLQFKKLYLLYFLPCLALLLLLPFVAPKINGARSWFYIAGFGIQPTEFIKLGLVLYLGALISRKGPKFRSFKRGLLPIYTMVAIICGLIMLQPDLGGALIIGLIAITVIIVGGVNLRQLLFSGLIILLLVAILVGIGILTDSQAWNYRIDRITSFLDPTGATDAASHQLSRALQAVGHGGFLGVGYGQSVQKLNYLTYSYSDSIFAIIAEEFGFLGSGLFLIFYVLFLCRGLLVALRCKNTYGTLVGVGIVAMLGIQALINIGGITGAMPLTGVTLPFISHGGSSLIVSLMAIGILLSISREYNKEQAG
jgi:cell division protein FtsW